MYCLSCGAANNDLSNFCQNCGASRDLFRVIPSGQEEITQVSQAFKQPQYAPKSGNQSLVLIIAGIIVIMAVGAAGYFYAKSEMKQANPVSQKNNDSVSQQLNSKSNTSEKQTNSDEEELAKQQKNEDKELKRQEELEWKKFDSVVEVEAKNKAQKAHPFLL